MFTEKEIKSKIGKLYRSNLFSSLDLLQILKVLSGVKHSTRLIFETDKKTEKRISLLDALNIPYKQIISADFDGIRDRGKGGWSNLCSKSKKHICTGIYLGLYSVDVDKAVDAEKSGNDNEFGSELSYPACCNKFFSDNFEDASKIQGDLFPLVYKYTPDRFSTFSYLLNPLWYFDAGFIEYWPCSFRCSHALAEANIGKSLLQKYLPRVATEMKKKLKAPVLYTEYSGIFCFADSHYDETSKTLQYNPKKILCTKKTKLFEFLQAGNRLCYQTGFWHIYKNNKKIHKIINSFASVAIFDDTGLSTENTMFKIIKQYQALGLNLPRTTEVEILMLLAGKKKALRLIVDSDDYAKALDLAKLLTMEYYISPKRVAVISSPGTGDEYVDYVLNAPSNSKYLICFAKNKANAEKCAQLETMATSESKKQLNTLLNYPSCCVKSFLNRTPHEDWIKPFLRRSPIVNWYPAWTNRLGYLFTGVMPLYDYEPCSAFCEGSLALAQTIKDTFREKNMEFFIQGIVRESSEPVFLHNGVLVLMCNANVKKTLDGAEIIYNPASFQLKDYKLKPGVENSLFWESNKMLISGKNISLFKDNALLQSIKQTQYNNRIFLFEE